MKILNGITAKGALTGALVALGFTLHLMADTPPAVPTPAATANPPGAAPASASDPFVKKGATAPADVTGPQNNLVLTYEFYMVNQAEGARLLQERETDQALYDHLRDLVKQGKGRLDALMCGSESSGEQISLEQLDVAPFPISFGFFGPAKTVGASDFKKRNLGYRLVIKAQSITGDTGCDLSMFPEHTKLNGFAEANVWLGDTQLMLPQPVFSTQRVNTKPPILSFGQIHLLGTFSPALIDSLPPVKSQSQAASKEDEIGLFFARVSRVPYDPGQAVGRKFSSVDLEMTTYSMDREQALQILSQPQKPGAAYDAVQSLVKSSQAKLEHLSVIRTRVGLKANCAESVENPYPASASGNEWLTQDLGFNAEVQPTLMANDSIIRLDVTKYEFMKNIGPLHADGLIGTLCASQPIFEVQSIVTKINTSAGEHALLGTISPPGDTGVNGRKDEGRVWLAFIRPTFISP